MINTMMEDYKNQYIKDVIEFCASTYNFDKDDALKAFCEFNNKRNTNESSNPEPEPDLQEDANNLSNSHPEHDSSPQDPNDTTTDVPGKQIGKPIEKPKRGRKKKEENVSDENQKEGEGDAKVVKKRGRKKKEENVPDENQKEGESDAKVVKKRGRKKKEENVPDENQKEGESDAKVVKKRGRPKKTSTQNIVALPPEFEGDELIESLINASKDTTESTPKNKKPTSYKPEDMDDEKQPDTLYTDSEIAEKEKQIRSQFEARSETSLLPEYQGNPLFQTVNTIDTIDDEFAVTVRKFTHEDQEYFRDEKGNVYDTRSSEQVGIWDPNECVINPLPTTQNELEPEEYVVG